MGRADVAGPLSAPTVRASVVLAVAMVVYASLYPFEGWRAQVPKVSEWLLSPWPRYWTASDLWVNWLGYVPLGGVLVLWLCRSRRQFWRVGLATVIASALSLGLESLQSWMVHRVASNLDWVFNTLGGACGAWLMWRLLGSFWLQSWGAWRRAHLMRGSGLVLMVLLLWLLLQVLPTLLPFAVGRLPPDLWEAAWSLWTAWWPHSEPWAWSGASWWPQVATLTSFLLVPLGLLRFTWRDPWSRVAATWSFLAAAVLVPTLGHVWSYGWTHAGDWLLPPVAWAVLAAAVLAPALMSLPQLWMAIMLGMALGLQWLGVNVLAETGYWAWHWQAFTQGQFVRWYGLLTWVAVLWPLLAMALLVRSRLMSRRTAMA